MCIAMSFTRALNSGVRATKSVSQLTSTREPTFSSGAWMYEPTTPSEAARPAFLAAAARPFLRRIWRALSRSPLASTRADLQSIMPAPVSSRSWRTISAEMFMTSSMKMCLAGTPRDGLARVRPAASGRRGRGSRRRHRPRAGAHGLAGGRASLVGGGVHPACLAQAPAGQHRVRHPAREEPDRPQRVVIARDQHVHLVGIAVRVHHAHHGDLELARLRHRDRLLAGVDHEHGVGHALHALDADQVLLELHPLLLELRDLLLGELLLLGLGPRDELQLLQPVQALAHGHEVREEPAQPALGHVGHAAALRLLDDRLLGLPLGADEQDGPALRGQVLHVLERFLEQPVRLLQVDDVDAVALAEDEFLHLRVPALGLVPEMYARLEQVLDADAGGGRGAGGGGRQKTASSLFQPRGPVRGPGAFRPLVTERLEINAC